MEIHVKNQTAGVITYVEGNQVIHGGLHGNVVPDQDARQAVRELREALSSLALPGRSATQARAQVTEIDVAVRGPRPDKSRVADTLGRLTELLARAGALTTAGAALTGPLYTLASWLGTHGAAILGMLAQ